MKTSISTSQKQGFTFIEVIMVMVIIGILSLIAIPKYLDIKKSSGRAAYYTLRESLEAHGAQIYAKCAATGKAGYPLDASTLISGSAKPGDCMENGMPDSGFEMTALSPSQISIELNGVTKSYSYNSVTGKVSGEYE